MITLPSEVDVSKLSKQEANGWFTSLVQGFMEPPQSLDFNAAWSRVKLSFHLLAEKAFAMQSPDAANLQPAGRYSDSSPVIPGAVVPPNPYAGRRAGAQPNLAQKLMPSRSVSLPNEGNIEALGLPADCSFEEFRAADLANGGKSPRDSKAIFDALVSHHASRGMDPGTATAHAQKRYPEVAAEAQQAEQAARNRRG